MRRHLGAVAIVLACLGAVAHGQRRTDVVELSNGDRITGEILALERGRLEFKTDDAGTLFLEWDKVARLIALRLFEVVVGDGRRYLGRLAGADPGWLMVVDAQQRMPLPMSEVTNITPIGTSFWRKIDGSFDAGFTYTRSSAVAQLNINSQTVYRAPAYEVRGSVSATTTSTDDGESGDDRGAAELSYLRHPWRRWFIAVAGRFERNESLGIALRSQAGISSGPRVINTNRGQLALGAGIVGNDERGVDVEPVQTLEAVLLARSSFYTYDRPTTTFDATLQYYPSLSDPGRHRIQLDAAVKQELFKDFFVSASLFNTYDNRPPNPSSNSNDIGTMVSLGWRY